MSSNLIITGITLPDFIQQLIAELSPHVRLIVQEELHAAQNSLEEKYISEKEARKILPVTAPTFGSVRSKGLFPSYRVGARVFYKPSEIMEAAKRIRKYDRDKQVA